MKLIVGLSGNLPSQISGNSFLSEYNSFYRPFFQILYGHSSIPIVLYFSGLWYEWLAEEHPEVLSLISEMMKKNRQIEILGGAYYEPYLPLLQTNDRTGQIDFLTTAIRQRFMKRPKGCLIDSNSWDNSLISCLKSCGIDYVFLDKSALFYPEGYRVPDYHVSMTEDQGKIITIFPLANKLLEKGRQMAPEDFIQKLLQIKGKDPVVSLFFDFKNIKVLDLVWLDEFFRLITANKAIELISPSQYLKDDPAIGREYFQSRNICKNVLLKSEELDNLYAKMIYVQTLANSIRGDKYKKKSALDELWKGQGYFSAFTCQASRKAYSCFITSEKLSRNQESFISSLVKYDFKLKGYNQFMYKGDTCNAYIQRAGGLIFEFDNIPTAWNYASYCPDNQYPGLFRDSMYSPDQFRGDVETLTRSGFEDFSSIVYDVDDYDRENKKLVLSFRHKTAEGPIRIIKTYRFFNFLTAVKYELINIGGLPINIGGAVSFNISLSSPEHIFQPKILEKGIEFEDKSRTITITSDRVSHFTYRNIFHDGSQYLSTLIYAFGQTGTLDPGKSCQISFELSCH